MFFNKDKKKSNFVKAKTPEARKKQKQAIAAYYAKKKEAAKKNQEDKIIPSAYVAEGILIIVYF